MFNEKNRVFRHLNTNFGPVYMSISGLFLVSDIGRRLRIPGSTSLADLHHMIQIVNGWDDDHLHCFHIYGKDYGVN